MSPVVIDGSAALALVLPDEASEVASAAAEALAQGTALFAPAHWSLEVANGLLMAERRKRISAADAMAALNYLRQLPIVIEEESAERAFAETSGIARRYDLTAYDAAYLELAMRRRASLATLDRPLRKAAAAAGVPLL
jgi:predicted nucleic acid-binding protein